MEIPDRPNRLVPIDPVVPKILPHEKVYSIQVGGKLFRVSGASLSFDAPSYFTDFFSQEGNESKLLVLDRSPLVFEKIYSHLQGYSIKIDNGYEFMHLYADSEYFNLDKLKKRLLTDNFYFEVGGQEFRVSRDIFYSEGNYPNYFTVADDAVLQNPHTFNLLKNLLRPPPVSPHKVDRSPELFQDLVTGLQNSRVQIRDEHHRDSLLAECRYYRFMALEQLLIRHRIQSNPFTREEEIVINYSDLKKSGMSSSSKDMVSGRNLVKYSRPYVDKHKPRTLVMQIESSEASLLINTETQYVSLLFIGKTASKLKNVLSQVSDDLMFEQIEKEGKRVSKLSMLLQLKECHTRINGLEVETNWYEKFYEMAKINSNEQQEGSLRGNVIEVKLMKSQWTIGYERRDKIWLNGIMIDGVLDSKNYYKRSGFI